MLSVRGRQVGAVALSFGFVVAAASCGDSNTATTTNTVSIKPSSYAVREAVTTTTATPVTGPDGEGRSDVEQAYIIEPKDVPYAIAELYEIDVDELRTYNGWAEDYGDYPGVGSTVRIPPGAKFIDPNASTTSTTSGTPDDSDPESTTEGTTEGSTDSSDPAVDDDCTPAPYTVEVDDNPILIAAKFDVTLEALTAANGWNADYTNFQRAGEQVTIPPAASCTTVPTT
ncbi:MAG: LysM peptidoglycan-binding domain-containing protein [Ilumatobacteraceae bacterium]